MAEASVHCEAAASERERAAAERGAAALEEAVARCVCVCAGAGAARGVEVVQGPAGVQRWSKDLPHPTICFKLLLVACQHMRSLSPQASSPHSHILLCAGTRCRSRRPRWRSQGCTHSCRRWSMRCAATRWAIAGLGVGAGVGGYDDRWPDAQVGVRVYMHLVVWSQRRGAMRWSFS